MHALEQWHGTRREEARVLDRTLQTGYSIHTYLADVGTGPAAGGGPAPGPGRSAWSSS